MIDTLSPIPVWMRVPRSCMSGGQTGQKLPSVRFCRLGRINGLVAINLRIVGNPGIGTTIKES